MTTANVVTTPLDEIERLERELTAARELISKLVDDLFATSETLERIRELSS